MNSLSDHTIFDINRPNELWMISVECDGATAVIRCGDITVAAITIFNGVAWVRPRSADGRGRLSRGWAVNLNVEREF